MTIADIQRLLTNLRIADEKQFPELKADPILQAIYMLHQIRSKQHCVN